MLVSTKIKLVVDFKGTVLCPTRSLTDALVPWYGAHQQLNLDVTTGNLRNVLFQCNCPIWTQIPSLWAWKYHRSDRLRKVPFFFPASSLVGPLTVKNCSDISARIRHLDTNWCCKQTSSESACYHWTKIGSALMPSNKEGEFMRVWTGHGKSKEQSQKSATVHKTSGWAAVGLSRRVCPNNSAKISL